MLSTSTILVRVLHTLPTRDDSNTEGGGILVANVVWYLRTMLIHHKIVQISRRLTFVPTPALTRQYSANVPSRYISSHVAAL